MKKLFFILLVIISCDEPVREETVSRYDNGKKKTIMKFIEFKGNEIMIEKITLSIEGDTIRWESYDRENNKDGWWIENNFSSTPNNGEYDSFVLIGRGKYKKNDRWEGIWANYDRNGILQYEANYLEGKMNGNVIFYGPNKNVVQVSELIDNQRHGKDTRYLESGLVVETYYTRGFKDGTSTTFLDETRKVKLSEENYKKDIRNGLTTNFYENGQIQSFANYINGDRNGEAKTYFESGEVNKIYNFINGKQDGTLKVYFKNGNLQVEETFKEGLHNGRTLWYHENGKVKVEKFYINGRSSGNWVAFYDTGELEGRGEFKDGEGYWVSFFKNGQKQNQGPYLDEKKHGIWKLYNKNGEKIQEAKFVNGEISD